MIACLDVHYHGTRATAAGIVFSHWTDASAIEERVVSMADVQPYRSGRFFLRELPCLLAVLEVLPPVKSVIVDGYVWLEDEKPGLGEHLHQALESRPAVIGVAKTRYVGAVRVREVTRGKSTRPLFITAAGIDVGEAAEHIRSMHGPNRIPTLLQKVDSLSRGLKE